MPGLKTAADQINSARTRQKEARRARERALLPIRIIDAMLAQLEELHLEAKKRVPETFESQLELLQRALPADLRDDPELRSRITIAHLMDRLYTLQDHLLSRHVSRDAYDDDDLDALPDDPTTLRRAS